VRRWGRRRRACSRRRGSGGGRRTRREGERNDRWQRRNGGDDLSSSGALRRPSRRELRSAHNAQLRASSDRLSIARRFFRLGLHLSFIISARRHLPQRRRTPPVILQARRPTPRPVHRRRKFPHRARPLRQRGPPLGGLLLLLPINHLIPLRQCRVAYRHNLRRFLRLARRQRRRKEFRESSFRLRVGGGGDGGEVGVGV
jgi:hypothetical protein